MNFFFLKKMYLKVNVKPKKYSMFLKEGGNPQPIKVRNISNTILRWSHSNFQKSYSKTRWKCKLTLSNLCGEKLLQELVFA